MAIAKGTTSDAYTSDPAIAWDTKWLRPKEITIRILNVSTTSNSLDYEIYTWISYAEGVSTKQLEYTGTVAPGDLADFEIYSTRERVEVYLKSSVSGSPADFEIQTGFTEEF